ncbi:hypothetical protein ACFSQT_15755 [Mesorhizobium calcicola]|uniref:Transposase n=1 Tax=Mesorhizobium calcicola TaxID=1300310 RepID=A0ABW4WDB0_9HYPH
MLDVRSRCCARRREAEASDKIAHDGTLLDKGHKPDAVRHPFDRRQVSKMLAYAGTLEGCAVKMVVIFRSRSRNNNAAPHKRSARKNKRDAFSTANDMAPGRNTFGIHPVVPK